MKNNSSSNKTSISSGCLNWPAFILSISLIAIRAFQPGAQPIESWSISSWVLMLLPIIAIVALQIIIFFLMLATCITFSASDSHI